MLLMRGPAEEAATRGDCSNGRGVGVSVGSSELISSWVVPGRAGDEGFAVVRFVPRLEAGSHFEEDDSGSKRVFRILLFSSRNQ